MFLEDSRSSVGETNVFIQSFENSRLWRGCLFGLVFCIAEKSIGTDFFLMSSSSDSHTYIILNNILFVNRMKNL